VAQSSGNTMIDPLSLNDFPEIKSGEVFHVDVQNGGEAEDGFASKNERK
jgi:hypothetical protein